MTNPPILVITGLGGYFILNFLQKSGYIKILAQFYCCVNIFCYFFNKHFCPPAGSIFASESAITAFKYKKIIFL